jgi:hypothetical protein
MQEIQVVCNLNIARSPFLCAFLKLHFHNVSFSSSGINARSTTETSPLALQIANKWGFAFDPAQSKCLTLESGTKYLPVDSNIEIGISNLGANNCLSGSSIDQSSYFIRKPVDPINLTADAFAYELSILLNYGVKIILNEFPPLDRHAITVIEFSGEDSEGTNLFDYISRRQEDVYVVNVCLRNLQVHGSISELFSVSRLLERNTSTVGYSSRYEVLEPEKLLCSIEWRQWLYHLATSRPVVLLVSPIAISEQMMIPETILATLWADRFASSFDELTLLL